MKCALFVYELAPGGRARFLVYGFFSCVLTFVYNLFFVVAVAVLAVTGGGGGVVLCYRPFAFGGR